MLDLGFTYIQSISQTTPDFLIKVIMQCCMPVHTPFVCMYPSTKLISHNSVTAGMLYP